MIVTIPNDTKVTIIEYSPKFSCICSVGKSPSWGIVHIIYQPKDRLLEFISFENWLIEMSAKEMTIEEFNQLVFNALTQAGIEPDEVSIEAQTIVHGNVRSTIKGVK